jgi:hypothetical protein
LTPGISLFDTSAATAGHGRPQPDPLVATS